MEKGLANFINILISVAGISFSIYFIKKNKNNQNK